MCSHSSYLGKLAIPNWALCKGGRIPSFWELEEIGALDVEEARWPEYVGVRALHVEASQASGAHTPLCFAGFGLPWFSVDSWLLVLVADKLAAQGMASFWSSQHLGQ